MAEKGPLRAQLEKAMRNVHAKGVRNDLNLNGKCVIGWKGFRLREAAASPAENQNIKTENFRIPEPSGVSAPGAEFGLSPAPQLELALTS